MLKLQYKDVVEEIVDGACYARPPSVYARAAMTPVSTKTPISFVFMVIDPPV
ncbi:hypothetical protein [Paraburkholderia sp. UCT2]|uniref:hypothetical protein n=1 Tax=Paraburkholderia sp. UCT2 TaxID=2615208 RepID=UPI0016567FB6|nr:hypothetical protein [Paraburkholderia sp. UCT2]